MGVTICGQVTGIDMIIKGRFFKEYYITAEALIIYIYFPSEEIDKKSEQVSS